MMNENIEKQTMMDALNYLFISELPEKLEEGKIWAKAIVHVTKCDNSKNYAVAINDGYGNAKVIKDFGNVASIVRINEIYPYLYLTNGAMPNLLKQSDIISYLKNAGEDEDKIKSLLSSTCANGDPKSKEDKDKGKQIVKSLVIKHAVDRLLDSWEEKQRQKNIFNTELYG